MFVDTSIRRSCCWISAQIIKVTVNRSLFTSCAQRIADNPSLTLTSTPSVLNALKDVIHRAEAASRKRPEHVAALCTGDLPRVVAVSKTKPASAIIDCYLGGDQRHFGENYAKELLKKATDPDVLRLCPDIKWHFIGPASSTSNVKTVMKCPNLFVVETVQNTKIVDFMNQSLSKSNRKEKLNVMLQINTSGEPQKGGVLPGVDALSLTRYVLEAGVHLNLKGFMTIGSFGHDVHTGPNPDFVRLVETRDSICRELNLRPEDFELSMGMSGDFEHAIEMGSSNVRIGSTIFGAREAK